MSLLFVDRWHLEYKISHRLLLPSLLLISLLVFNEKGRILGNEDKARISSPIEFTMAKQAQNDSYDEL